MKLKPLILWCIALAVGSVAVWLACRPSPSIRFVAFEEGKHGPVAVFQIVNDTGSSFAAYGYGPASLCYFDRMFTPSGWKKHSHIECTMGELRTFAAHSVTKFKVPVPHHPPAVPFAVGVYFQRGTAEEVRLRRGGALAKFVEELRYVLDRNYDGPEFTWSDVVQQQ